MKTYKKIEESPRLVITYDECTYSPRENTNLGYFITIDRDYRSPDKNKQIEFIVKDTGENANNVTEHMDMIKENIENDTNEKVLAIYPVTKYEHSSVSYSLGTSNGFDCSNNGFYIITDKTQKEFGTPRKLFEDVIKSELSIYTQWANGEVYRFELFNENGENVDGCGGFYSIEDIKENLSEEWADENLADYFQNV